MVSLGQRSGQSRAEQWSTSGKEVVRVGQRSGIGAGKSSGQIETEQWSVWVRARQSSGQCTAVQRAMVKHGYKVTTSR